VHKPREHEKKKNPRGVFERPPGSDVWWVNYYHRGRQHREKVGRKGDAIKLYQDRRTAIRRGEKLPELKRTAPVMVADLIDLMLEHVKAQNHRDLRTYESRGQIVRTGLGARDATALTPQDLETWLAKRCKTAGTFNRYKALISLAYRQGIRNRKVTDNPAKLIPQRKEQKGRIRFLSREEYTRLHEVIARRFPEHLAEFVVSVLTGMRLTEQYSVPWALVNFDRRVIDLTKTKNFTPREVHLNADAVAALRSIMPPGKLDRKAPVFPREERPDVIDRKLERFDTRSWFVPCLEEAEIHDYVWHCNRHTFCSWLAMAGASTRDIMEAAGHKTITQAARYSHLSPQHTQSVVDRISGTPETGNMHHNRHQPKTGTKRSKNNGK
jgi:site-specific recombinase XerD